MNRMCSKERGALIKPNRSGNALINFGQAQSKLADCQDDFANSMKYDYLDKLEEGMNQFKEYQSLRKKLESRRLDYDAKLARLQKSKKEKPELEQEMQAAKIKYEEAEYDVIQKLASLQEFEVNEQVCFLVFLIRFCLG